MIDKEDFIEMIRDWQADNSPEYDDLEIGEPEIDINGDWSAIAKDDKNAYEITAVNGNIYINYLGAK
jgi:hypothetical protein